jgi:hypothetical protein
MKPSRKAKVGVLALVLGAAAVALLVRLVDSPSVQRAPTDGDSTSDAADVARKEIDARRLAALGLDAQPIEIQKRYYEARLQTARQAIETQETHVAALEAALGHTADSPSIPPEHDAALRAQLSDARDALSARTTQLQQWQGALTELREIATTR